MDCCQRQMQRTASLGQKHQKQTCVDQYSAQYRGGANPLQLLPAMGELFIEPSSDFSRNDDGLSEGMDRLKQLGNAVVPQIAELIGKAILQAEVA